MIELDRVTKDYGSGRGVFDLTLTVQPGEAFGFLGPNGAGKTVTMRMLMGFVQAGSGAVHIAGLDCFDERPAVQRLVGYLPGELVVPRAQTGREFLALLGELKRLGLQGRRRCDELIDYFEVDPTARMGSMSKGTRQKVGLVAAFMGDPQVLLLDEPTSGLDPVMQERFVRLVAACKKRGATVLLSSHIFGEVGRVCDRVGFVRAGRLVRCVPVDRLASLQGRTFRATFSEPEQAREFCARWPGARRDAENPSVVAVRGCGGVTALLEALAACGVADLETREQTLEELFRAAVEEGVDHETSAVLA